MYAIVETGAKQYRVSKGDLLEIERLDLKDKKEVKLDKVLFVSDKKDPSVGKPYIKGASVVCEVVGEKRGKKSISFKYRRRLGNSRRKVGHRQNYTVLKVKEIAA
ncbi:MAG: 50S ribosomal protein L21 [Candidatus Omnitrophica bacterium]|nr:50S ribosomal protein L21 [Candidatus Omnitrophota bacterium]MBU4590040.1 50S ribosomal protein L21 [Candidatus Omnitrophota bacterium]